MNTIDLVPGCYTVPLGSDPLRWLAQQCVDTCVLNPMVILPTRRSVNRFQRLLYVINPTLARDANVIAYEDLSVDPMPQIAAQRILWEFANRSYITEELFQKRQPSLNQRQQIAVALNSVLSEMYAHEIDQQHLKRAFESGVPTRQLTEIINEYEDILNRSNLVHSVAALINGIKSFSHTFESLNRPIYLIIDGITPPALHQLAANLSKDHYVFIYGDVPWNECPGYDQRNCYASLLNALQSQNISISPLEIYTPRKSLVNKLQKPVFDATEIAQDFKGIHFIEHSNDVFLANDIIDIAKRAQSEKIKSITVVTPDQNLAKIIHMQAKTSGISVDDSCGILLNDTLFGSLLIQMLRSLGNSSNYHTILNLISHPQMNDYWGELPAKLDVLGRLKNLSFDQALRQYIPESDHENERLLSLIQFINLPPQREFAAQLHHALELLRQWGIRHEEHPEAVEILKIAELMDASDVLEFILSTTPYRTPTPKEFHIQIMGPLEARLMQPKVLVLASLNEGDWPMSASSNPLLHANLRKLLNLPDIDQITGISSKVLLSLLGCESIYICRTTHKNGQQTQPSRWWERLKVISKLNNLHLPCYGDKNHKRPLKMSGLESFKIPPELIPRRLSISDIQLLINDPKQFILRSILKLEELPMWEAATEFRYKGIIVHAALEKGVKQNLPADDMISFALNKLTHLNLDDHDRRFWESQIITNIRNFDVLNHTIPSLQTYSELKGEWNLMTQFGAITVVGKADRIDQLSDGSIHITDYKTGSLPSKQSVYKGESPQLPLLGMMMAKGAFKELPAKPPLMVSYWDLKEGTTLNFLFDDVSHLEQEFIAVIERLLNPDFEYVIT